MAKQQIKDIPTWAWYRKKITSFFAYRFDGNYIYLGKKKYTYKQLKLLAYVIRFLSFMLFSISLYAYLKNKKIFNLISCIIAVVFFLYGVVFKMIVTQSKIDKQCLEDNNKC